MKTDERIVMTSISSEIFFQAKIKEFEAACYVDDAGRIAAATENCHSALQGWMDAKSNQIKDQIKDFRRNNK